MEAVAEETTEAIETIHDRLIDTVTAGQRGDRDDQIGQQRDARHADPHAHRDLRFRRRTDPADLETQQAFLRCRNLDDIRGVQVQYLRTALDQYGVEPRSWCGSAEKRL